MSDTTCRQLHQCPITSASNYNRITLAVPSSGPPPAPPRPSRTGRRALGPRCCSRRLGWAGWAGPRTPAGTTWTRSCGASTGTTPWRATSASSQTSGGWILVFKKLHPKVRIHGEGPYYGLLLLESSRFQPEEGLLRDYEPPLGASFQALVDITEQQRES